LKTLAHVLLPTIEENFWSFQICKWRNNRLADGPHTV